MSKQCKHVRLSHIEAIEAYHGTYYDSNGDVWFNNEYGNQIYNLVICQVCCKKWRVTKSSPKFVKEFQSKVEIDRENNMK